MGESLRWEVYHICLRLESDLKTDSPINLYLYLFFFLSEIWADSRNFRLEEQWYKKNLDEQALPTFDLQV